jgi:hypothetical protein
MRKILKTICESNGFRQAIAIDDINASKGLLYAHDFERKRVSYRLFGVAAYK